MSLDRPWLAHYPKGVDPEMTSEPPPHLVALMEESFQKYPNHLAFRFMGSDWSYQEWNDASRALAAYFQSLGLEPGARIAVMLPNLPQYPIVAAAIFRAGYVLVNVNPLYTPRELMHQLQDSGATTMVVLENFAATVEACIHKTQVQHVVLTTVGEMLPWFKAALVNFVVRFVKKQVPAYRLPNAIGLQDAGAKGQQLPLKDVSQTLTPESLAVLQYTGGTTGVAKGAMLSHRNLVANVLQSEAWYRPALVKVGSGEQVQMACPLPLYHIFAFTVCMMLSLRIGGRLILIPNPRDLPSLFKALAAQPVHVLPAVNTLFAAMLAHPEFDTVNWGALKMAIGGGAAVQSAVAAAWQAKTGSGICQGYGLSETSPCVACNPTDSVTFNGSIGLPLPSTDIRIVDENEQVMPYGEAGEIVVKGPQVMQGYWQRPEETQAAMTQAGYFKTGDIGVMDEAGYIRIVDRKKDMILVSGFNVYPNEVEEVVGSLAGVAECAAVGVPDEKSGEAVKVFVVPKAGAALTEEAVKAHCRDKLTGYKQPRFIAFRTSLPKTPVGKILRRELRSA